MIYQLLIRLLSPLIVLLIALDGYKRKGGWRFFSQRLGFGYPATRPGAIWLHCASVGEVKAIEQLVKSRPHQAWLLTTNTPTGWQTAKDLKLDAELYYLPFDWPYAIQRFLRATQPSQLWVVETELWPNLFRLSKQHGLSIHIINGRISHRTLRAPSWLKQQYQRCLQQVDQILARSKTEAERFITLGADVHRIYVLGNLKQAGLHQASHHPRPIEPEYVLLASSHEDEELRIAKIWQALNRPECLVIVPRHPKRGAEILSSLQKHGLAASLSEQGKADENTRVWIQNKFGVLMPLFEHAKLVIMGGSFVPKGGHNFLEPAAYGKAIITGPDNRDFEDELALFREQGAIIACEDYDKLQQRLNQLLTNGALCQELGKHAKHIIQNQPEILTRYQTALKLTD